MFRQAGQWFFHGAEPLKTGSSRIESHTQAHLHRKGNNNLTDLQSNGESIRIYLTFFKHPNAAASIALGAPRRL